MKKLLFLLLLLLLPLEVLATSVNLAWDASVSTNVSSYKLFMSNTSGTYTTGIDVGKVLTYTVPNLTSGTTYFFIVKAEPSSTDINAVESGPSNEVSVTPVATPLQPPLNLHLSSLLPLAISDATTQDVTDCVIQYNGSINKIVPAINGVCSVDLTPTGKGTNFFKVAYSNIDTISPFSSRFYYMKAAYTTTSMLYYGSPAVIQAN